MYAIVETGGKQFKVAEGDRIRVPRMLNVTEDETISLDSVLMIADSDSSEIGRPLINGAAVKCRVLGEGRTQKTIVYKFKRRKDYRRKLGSRAYYTRLLVEKIDKA